MTNRENKQPCETQPKQEGGGHGEDFLLYQQSPPPPSIKMTTAADRLYINASGSGMTVAEAVFWEENK